MRVDRDVQSDSWLARLRAAQRRPIDTDWSELIDLRPRWREWAVDLGIAYTIVIAMLLVWLRPWDVSLRSPLVYEGDWLQYAMNVRSILDNGWVQTTDRLGAPFGQEMYDFPIGGDNANFLVMRIITFFTADVGLVLNLFYVFGFLSVTATSYVVLRMLRAGRRGAIVATIVFVFAPFHFIRDQHQLLAHYAILPVGVLLAFRAATGRSLRTEGASRWATGGWILACLAVGSFGAYYAIFITITIVFAVLVAAVAVRSIRPLTSGAILAALIVVTLVINQIGSLLYWSSNGTNDAVGGRAAIETDLLSLRIVQMLSPVPGTGLPIPASISEKVAEGMQSEPSQYLGVVTAGALIALTLWVIGRALGIGGNTADHPDVAPRLLATTVVAWILVASAGGFSWIVWVAGFERIRGWGRVSILVQFLVLAWATLVVPRWLTRLDGQRVSPRAIVWALSAVVIALVSIDQNTPEVQPTPGANEVADSSDDVFFAGIEAELPTGALVAQLPIRRFPEELPTERSGDYDLVRPYIHTDDLKWSYGGMKGREADWQIFISQAPPLDLANAFVAFGFEGIVIDRFGYADRAAELEDGLTSLLGSPLEVSPDQRWSYIRLDGSPNGLDQASLDGIRSYYESAAAGTL